MIQLLQRGKYEPIPEPEPEPVIPEPEPEPPREPTPPPPEPPVEEEPRATSRSSKKGKFFIYLDFQKWQLVGVLCLYSGCVKLFRK